MNEKDLKKYNTNNIMLIKTKCKLADDKFICRIML